MHNEILTPAKTLAKKIIFQLRWKIQPPIFVYQMGKVASSSIYASLNKQYLLGNVIHGHHFRPRHYYWRVEKLYDYYEEQRPLKIITLVREPVGRNISAFFHNSHHNPENKKVDFDLFNSTSEELKEIFLNNYDHEWPLTWFDKNIKENFNIDVYKKQMPKSGYQIYQNNNTQLLVLKHNINDKLKEKIISNFTGIDSFKLININIGADKEYASVYNQFQRDAKLPDWYLDKMLYSKYTQHFYTPEEIEKVLKKWK